MVEDDWMEKADQVKNLYNNITNYLPNYFAHANATHVLRHFN